MNPVSAIGQVCSGNILASRQQVGNRIREESTQRDLERTRRGVSCTIITKAGVQVEGIPTDSNRIAEVSRARASMSGSRNILLEDASTAH